MRRFFFIVAVATWLASPAAAGNMITGAITSQPVGHFNFCKSYPAECDIWPEDQGPLPLTSKKWRLIVSVNTTVNRLIRPMSDYDIFGQEEVWSYPVLNPHIVNSKELVGDCEDYALEKRRRLHMAGISLANLLITVVRKIDGEGHAILTVRTDKGDFILDNLTQEVKSWRDTPYTFLKRQSSYRARAWENLDNTRYLVTTNDQQSR